MQNLLVEPLAPVLFLHMLLVLVPGVELGITAGVGAAAVVVGAKPLPVHAPGVLVGLAAALCTGCPVCGVGELYVLGLCLLLALGEQQRTVRALGALAVVMAVRDVLLLSSGGGKGDIAHGAEMLLLWLVSVLVLVHVLLVPSFQISAIQALCALELEV